MAWLGSACASAPAPTGDAPLESTCDVSTTLEFSPDVADDAVEGYSCFSYPVDLGGRSIAAIRWQDPPAGPIRVHHATLQAASLASTASMGSCEPTPADIIALHVHAPGGGPLELAPDVGLSLPASAKYLRIEVHALRTGTGSAPPASVQICQHAADPPKLAAWLGLAAPVPAIRPHTTETSTGRCELGAPIHLLSAWPHMHRVGRAFHATITRGPTLEPLLDVPNWDFSHQLTYALDTDLAAHDVIAPTCIWENPMADYVLPGPYTSNEMCTFGLIGWPAQAAACVAAAP